MHHAVAIAAEYTAGDPAASSGDGRETTDWASTAALALVGTLLVVLPLSPLQADGAEEAEAADDEEGGSSEGECGPAGCVAGVKVLVAAADTTRSAARLDCAWAAAAAARCCRNVAARPEVAGAGVAASAIPVEVADASGAALETLPARDEDLARAAATARPRARSGERSSALSTARSSGCMCTRAGPEDASENAGAA